MFSVKYIEGLQHIWKFTESVFLPKEIADKLKSNQVYILIGLKDKIEDDELKVSAQFKSDEEEKFGQANQKETTFMDFVTQWNELVEEIKKWIQNNSSVKSQLNLE